MAPVQDEQSLAEVDMATLQLCLDIWFIAALDPLFQILGCWGFFLLLYLPFAHSNLFTLLLSIFKLTPTQRTTESALKYLLSIREQWASFIFLTLSSPSEEAAIYP